MALAIAKTIHVNFASSTEKYQTWIGKVINIRLEFSQLL